MAATFGGPKKLIAREEDDAQLWVLWRCCNYDLKRWRAHGDGGASNSEARKKVSEWQIVGVGRRELQRK